jgi:uncharacterized damage-inducible protein DinB
MTHADLNKTFAKLEKQKAEIFGRLKGYDEKTLNQRPDPNAWSVMEVIDHLTIVERSSYQYLLKKMQDKDAAQKTGFKEMFRSILLNGYLASNKKFKAPSVTLPAASYLMPAEAEKAWTEARKDISSVWAGLPEELLDRNWFKHPAAGKLNLKQMLSFMKAHVAHHEKQIDRTLKAVAK